MMWKQPLSAEHAESVKEIDRICEQFEQQWQQNAAVRIEEVLANSPHALRDALLPELVEIEVWWRKKRNEIPRVEEYLERFPQSAKLLQAAFTNAALAETDRGSAAVSTGVGAGQPARDAGLKTLCPGARFGDYRLLEPIGKGGMGVVWKAQHVRLEKRVALKLLPARLMTDADAVERFHREMKALGRVEHPNIVEAADARQVDGAMFVVMRLIEGRDLRRLVKEDGPLPVGAACEVIRQAACGLAHVHEAGLVHRDVKPANLMLSPDGTVKLLDLGLAALRQDTPAPQLTEVGDVMGTVDFMAPEQFRDTSGVDHRADIYALGCTLWYLLTGKTPFSGPGYQTFAARAAAHMYETFPSLNEALPAAPPKLGELLNQMVQKKATDRPAHAADIAELIEPFADAGQLPVTGSTRVSRSGTHSESLPRTGLRRIGAPTVLGTLIVLCVAATLVIRWPASDTTRHDSSTTGSDDDSTVGDGVSDPVDQPVENVPVASVANPLEILSVTIEHLEAGEKADIPRGRIGAESFFVSSGDAIRLQAELSEPAYSYWIALRPDGVLELCYPEETGLPPPKSNEPRYPVSDPRYTYGLTDGSGLQAFALVVSDDPLPSFDDWLAGAADCPWRESLAAEEGVVYRHDGQVLTAFTPDHPYGGGRGVGRELRGAGDAERILEEVMSWLKGTSAFDVIDVWAFYVPPVE